MGFRGLRVIGGYGISQISNQETHEAPPAWTMVLVGIDRDEANVKYSNFEELPVWKAAIEFALKLFEFTNKADFRGLEIPRINWSGPACLSRITSLRDLNGDRRKN